MPARITTLATVMSLALFILTIIAAYLLIYFTAKTRRTSRDGTPQKKGKTGKAANEEKKERHDDEHAPALNKVLGYDFIRVQDCSNYYAKIKDKDKKSFAESKGVGTREDGSGIALIPDKEKTEETPRQEYPAMTGEQKNDTGMILPKNAPPQAKRDLFLQPPYDEGERATERKEEEGFSDWNESPNQYKPLDDGQEAENFDRYGDVFDKDETSWAEMEDGEQLITIMQAHENDETQKNPPRITELTEEEIMKMEEENEKTAREFDKFKLFLNNGTLEPEN